MSALAQVRQHYPDARHHCWAYLLGSPFSPNTMASSDDGEPSGTAGKPILNVLQHSDIGNAIIVVVRYFGGIKLGAGGLIRSYSSAAQQVLDSASKTRFVAMLSATIECSFAQEQYLRHLTLQHQGEVLSAEYQEQVVLRLQLPQAALDSFKAQCSLNQWKIQLAVE